MGFISGLFGGSPKAPPPPPPAAPPPPPAATPAQEAMGEAAGAQSRRKRAGIRASTLASGGAPALSGDTSGKTLLGL